MRRATRTGAWRSRRARRRALRSLLVAVTRSAEEFAARAGALPQALFATVEEGGEVIAIALRSPPRPLIASEMGQEAAERLLDAWLPEDPGVDSVVAPAAAAANVAAAWERRSGGRATLAIEEAAHRLERVTAPARRAAGALRAARQSDRALLVRWSIDFAREASDDYGDAQGVAVVVAG